jgi:transcription elongation factor Elf1
MIIPYKINQLENALKTSTVKLDRKFKCKLCEKEYASPSGRTRHF